MRRLPQLARMSAMGPSRRPHRLLEAVRDLLIALSYRHVSPIALGANGDQVELSIALSIAVRSVAFRIGFSK